MNRGIRGWAGAVAAALVLFLGVAGAKGQDEGGGGGTGAGGAEIDISMGSFGVGSIARAGEWVGIQVVTSDRATTPRQIVIRASIPDVDGDVTVYERSVASNPGVRQGAWLYFRLPMSFQSTDRLVVSVHEAEEAGDRLRAGRMLAREALPPRDVLRAYEGLVGVIGGGPDGLERYKVRYESQNSSYTPGGHEAVEVSATIQPEDMCDRWMGLMQFDAMVWTGDQPGKLDGDRAAAVKEWVKRGGHLVIVLPPVGQAWVGDDTHNPLADILPRVTVNRLEGVSLEPYRRLLADEATVDRPLPKTAVVHEFVPMRDAAPGEAVPIFANPPKTGNPKASVVVRRLVGCGAVTLVGIDLANKGLQLQGRPEADVFWHRVLGHRGKLYSAEEINNTNQTSSDAARTGRDPAIYDKMIVDMINMAASASQGVLLGFVVFIAYWLVAAPVSYGVLRKWGLTRHAWVAYAAAAALFTGIAWGGVSLIKPRHVSGSHVTLMDYVYGGDGVARTRTWATLLIPWYGDATVSVGEPGEAKGEFQNTVAPWDSSAQSDAGSFPDARPYMVESRSPDSLTFPTRSTVKQLQIDWAGGPRWLMLRPVVADVDPVTGQVVGGVPAKELITGKIELMPPRAGQATPALKGVLVNEMPAPLKRVRVFVVRGQAPLTIASPTAMLSDVEVYQKPNDWLPGEALSLEILTKPESTAKVPRGEGYLKGLVLNSGVGSDTIRPTDWPQALEGLGFISQFEPPDTSGGASKTVGERQSAHGWDLGWWFTQPCVIVTAQVGDAVSSRDGPCPAPIYVDRVKAPLEGVTVVRWIYPLAADPPAYQSE